MRTLHHVLIGILATATHLGCSNETVNSEDINEEKIYGQYAVHRDGTNDSLRLLSQFHVSGPSGTTVRLTKPSQVLADGEAMQVVDGDQQFLNFWGTFYRKEKDLDQGQEEVMFTLKHRDGQEYNNRIPIMPPVSASNLKKDQRLPRNDDLTIELKGEPLAAGEHFRCTIETRHEASDGSHDDISVDASSGNFCHFTLAQLASLPLGGATFKVQRIWHGDPEYGHEDEGGSLCSYYDSPVVEFVLE